LIKNPGIHDVVILNDLVALAEAVPLLTQDDLQTLNIGTPNSCGSMAVIAPGTGLGEAYLVWDGTRYRSYPSEGGHADFAPRSAEEIGLLVYLRRRFDHVSYERVCSGMGLPVIYSYLRETGTVPESASVRAQLKTASDPTPVIVRAALAGRSPCRLCRETLNLFVAILAAEAGNLALKVLATGGVYLGGGIPPRILDVLKEARFFNDFTNKGRFRELMQNIPVHVITNPQGTLLGAASVAMKMSEA
jgi:glucokinase